MDCDSGTPVALSRETLSAVPPGGDPQDRTASPRRWLLLTID
ncbi:MAG: hypothetical protein RMX68_024275 [Aulosira sp. ZfuVER01]|nr:hypothetical protein [Aulosira sp. DedVER01a]MDZ8050305.1 hypothetical protein [Aulosira sp. ZfuCHP01]